MTLADRLLALFRRRRDDEEDEREALRRAWVRDRLLEERIALLEDEILGERKP